MKNKQLLGFLLLSTPPMAMLALVAIFLIPD
jgi:hypothetical protein